MMQLIDRWQTQDGQWTVDISRPHGIDLLHSQRYRPEDIPGAGAANHIMVKAKPGDVVHVNTTDGKNPSPYTVDSSGWANHPMAHSSSYVPSRGEQGPWIVWVNGVEIARGIGLPDGAHVATWLITSDAATPPALPPIPQPSEPTDLYLPAIKAGQLREALRLAAAWIDEARGML